jgi:Putative Ig domain
MMNRVCTAQAAAVFVAVALTISCGGGGTSGGGSSETPPPPMPPPPPQFMITTSALPTGLVNAPYSAQLTAANGVGTLTWSDTSGIPPGLSLSSSGLISGTPTTIDDNLLSFTATDSSTPAKTVSKDLLFMAAGLFVDLRQGQIGVFYDNVIEFQQSVEPVSWSMVSGSLPPGVQMAPASAGSSQLNFTGMPTQVGTFNIVIRAQDANNLNAQQSASINIIPPALKITDAVMHLGVVNQPFDHLVTAFGGTPPYLFSVSSGALPAALQLNSTTGEISGTPGQSGLYQFNIKVVDATTPTSFDFEKPFTMLVTPNALPLRNDSLADATPIFPGIYTASLSPYTDGAGNPAPDHDYYVLTGNGGDIYLIGVSADYLLEPAANNPGPMTAPTQPALEILDGTGTLMATCNDPLADNPPAGAPFPKGAGNFTDACVDFGGNGALLDSSSLTLQLPPGSNQSFYIHVFDVRGRARPDFIYALNVIKQ